MVEVSEENPDSRRYVVGNKRTILIDFFFRKLQIFHSSWYWHQNLTSDCLLKLHCSVHSETESVHIATFSYIILCYTECFYFALWSFLIENGSVVYIDHLKNIGSLSYAILSNITIFYKNIFVNITNTFIWKLCKDWESLKLTVAISIFPEFSFSLKSMNFSWPTNSTSWFSLKWQDDFFYFKVNVCQILKAIFCLSVNFSSKNCIPWKEGDCYNSQLKWTSALSKESHDSQKCFFVYFSICQRKY